MKEGIPNFKWVRASFIVWIEHHTFILTFIFLAGKLQVWRLINIGSAGHVACLPSLSCGFFTGVHWTVNVMVRAGFNRKGCLRRKKKSERYPLIIFVCVFVWHTHTSTGMSALRILTCFFLEIGRQIILEGMILNKGWAGFEPRILHSSFHAP